MKTLNRQIILLERPKGLPDPSNFKINETEIPELKNGEIIVQTHYLSVDPYMRARMRDEESYAKPFEIGKPLKGRVVGRVVNSNHSEFEVGNFVTGMLDWADYSISDGNGIKKINPDIAPISVNLHVLGMPAITAYFGLLDIAKPKSGETVVVSGAAGAVGTVVGQLAKLKGCYVVGIAGSNEKKEFLEKEIGFDKVINYNATSNIKEDLLKVCPKGIDIYFDNVGGEISDVALSLLNFHSRVTICGQIAHYNTETIEMGPRLFSHFVTRSVLLKGFIVRDYAERFEEATAHLSEWFSEGKLKYRENIIEGLENAPNAFLGLFHGDNIGKQMVKVLI